MSDHRYDLIHRLLYRGEGTDLDYKSQQYKISGANDNEKAELIKDILAMVNSWRDSDAYILVGVKEINPGKATIVGLPPEQLADDSRFQQIVCEKMNTPPNFRYDEVEVSGKTVGLFTIPKQRRPIFLRKDYQHLKKNTVYVRRGSSTSIADPDEVSRMGIEDGDATTLEVFFHPQNSEKDSSSSISTLSEIIPASTFEQAEAHQKRLAKNMNHLVMASKNLYRNSKYWSEVVAYLAFCFKMKPFTVSCRNSGKSPARNVLVKMNFDSRDSALSFCDESSVLHEPTETHYIGRTLESAISPWDTHLQMRSTGAFIDVSFDLVRPGETATSSYPFYVGSNVSTELAGTYSVFAENCSPIHGDLMVNVESRILEDIWTDILEKYSER